MISHEIHISKGTVASLSFAYQSLQAGVIILCFCPYVVRLIDPTNDEPRLLKLKDWPTGDDFSEKLPKRY